MSVQVSTLQEGAPSEKLPGVMVLSKEQHIMLAVLGIVFWFAFAMVFRYTLPLGIFGGSVGVLTFVGTIPAGYGLVVLIQKVAKLSSAQLVPGFTFATACAALCDGMALTWMPSLYAAEPSQQVLAGAGVLWGVGTTLITAHVMALRG